MVEEEIAWQADEGELAVAEEEGIIVEARGWEMEEGGGREVEGWQEVDE